MLGDTFVLGLAAGSKTLPKINNDNYSSEYYLAESLVEYRVRVRHTDSTVKGVKYFRHNVEVTVTTYATLTTPELIHTAYVVLQAPPGDLNVEPLDALADWLIVSSNANIIKLFGKQS